MMATVMEGMVFVTTEVACFDMSSVHKMANMIERVIVLGMMATVMEGMAVEATEGPHLTICVMAWSSRGACFDMLE